MDTPDGRGTVVDVNLLRQSVKVRMESSPETVGCYKNCDICVLRSGKAKKNDPPIPADLAPISGSGQKPRPAEEKQESAFLEPVKFRYSTESLVEEKPFVPNQETQEEPRQRRPKQGRPKKPRSDDHPQGEKAEKPEKAEKHEKHEKAPRPPKKPRPERRQEEELDELPEQLKTEAVKEKIHRRKPYHHNRRRKPRENGGAPAGE